MALRSYFCSNCNKEIQKIVLGSIEEVSCECGEKMKLIIKAPESRVTEKRDYDKNKNVAVDIEKVVKERSKNYFTEHCVPDAIEKAASMVGEAEARRMAVRLNWIKADGTLKKKIDHK